ncbi:MAG TPA: transposase, partial [Archaeoglobaceae archaeon]|nr:transposase [Archaeoglobaceae archaeon]
MKKNETLLKKVKELYENGLGYLRISKYLWETKGIRVSDNTIRNWVKELGLKPHEAKKRKEGAPPSCKQRLKLLETENMNLKEEIKKT